jgi:SAM-dependent methyltransferase
VLDLGCGDGRLAALVLDDRPSVEAAVAVDRSEVMLAHARERFVDDDRVEVRAWDLDDPIGPLGRFDVVVSGFAIHHLDDERKRALFAEIAAQLEPGGAFLNLEVVASGSERRHADFLTAIGRTADDPEDRLVSVEDQVRWMTGAGLVDADCLWRWRGFALLVADAPR